ncbi:cornulin-like [Sarcophilus harrisii]|uniref:cornulin-like n=1 Tax=Sarcophilus harrisii TaxID=9305 RepID=UPI001301AFEE|nr:cornulin-like [Sarcophilus harrisii]
MPQLLKGIITVIDIFYKNSRTDGGCQRLSKQELKQLLHQEFGDALQKPGHSETADKILQLLDKDGDGTVDFSEFVLLIFSIVRACYVCIQPLLCPGLQEGERRSESWEPQEGRAEGTSSRSNELPTTTTNERNQIYQSQSSQDGGQHRVTADEKESREETRIHVRDENTAVRTSGSRHIRDEMSTLRNTERQVPDNEDDGQDYVRDRNQFSRDDGNYKIREKIPAPGNDWRCQVTEQTPEQRDSGKRYFIETIPTLRDKRNPQVMEEIPTQRGDSTSHVGEQNPGLRDAERPEIRVRDQIPSPRDDDRYTVREQSPEVGYDRRYHVNGQIPRAVEEGRYQMNMQSQAPKENRKYQLRNQTSHLGDVPESYDTEDLEVRYYERRQENDQSQLVSHKKNYVNRHQPTIRDNDRQYVRDQSVSEEEEARAQIRLQLTNNFPNHGKTKIRYQVPASREDERLQDKEQTSALTEDQRSDKQQTPDIQDVRPQTQEIQNDGRYSVGPESPKIQYERRCQVTQPEPELQDDGRRQKSRMTEGKRPQYQGMMGDIKLGLSSQKSRMMQDNRYQGMMGDAKLVLRMAEGNRYQGMMGDAKLGLSSQKSMMTEGKRF